MTITNPLTDITWHSAFWADALALADGALVGSLAMSGTAGITLTQSTNNNKPQFLKGKLGNRAVIKFAPLGGATTKYLNLASFTSLPQPFSIFAVFYSQQDGSQRLAAWGSNGSCGVSSGGAYYGASNTTLAGTTRSDGARKYVLVCNGASSRLRIDGSETTGDAGSNAMAALSLGAASAGGSYLRGGIAFFGIYAGAFTTTQQGDLEAWA